MTAEPRLNRLGALMRKLGPGWECLSKHDGTLVLLHDSGLFTEVSDHFAEHLPPNCILPMAGALLSGVRDGLRGRCVVCTKRSSKPGSPGWDTYTMWLEAA